MIHRLAPLPALVATAVLTFIAPAALAQPDSGTPSTPVTSSEPPPTPDANAAREALQKKEGDVDQSTLLKETLTAVDKQYSLLKMGKLQVTYDLNYTYIGSQTIDAQFTNGALTLFDLENVRSHTVTNTVEADYGILDNITGTFTLPLVSKFTQTNTFTGLTTTFGDIQVGGRWQPFSLTRGGTSMSINGSLRLPTGRSPFQTVQGHDLGTGQGYLSGTLGLNLSKVIDPVALFGSASLTLADAVNHLNDTNNGRTLVALKAGPSIGFGAGFAYALSYDITTTLSFQEAVSAPSHLIFADNTSAHTAQQVSGVVNLGLGVRVSPKTTVNFSLGLGLTQDSPNFSLGMNMPLSFGSVL